MLLVCVVLVNIRLGLGLIMLLIVAVLILANTQVVIPSAAQTGIVHSLLALITIHHLMFFFCLYHDLVFFCNVSIALVSNAKLEEGKKCLNRSTQFKMNCFVVLGMDVSDDFFFPWLGSH